jgi:hypothetical protein
VDEKAVQELRVKDCLSFLDAVLSSWPDEWNLCNKFLTVKPFLYSPHSSFSGVR